MDRSRPLSARDESGLLGEPDSDPHDKEDEQKLLHEDAFRSTFE
jgi:hypothetical protein